MSTAVAPRSYDLGAFVKKVDDPPRFVARVDVRRAGYAVRIGGTRTATGDVVFPTDAGSRLLRVIERSSYCLSIADAARVLRVSRQAAHRIAHVAAARGHVDLLMNPDDERILQVLLTPAGRAHLRADRAGEAAWLAALLNGLGDHEMATATHVVRVIRKRLERDARDLAQRNRVPLKSKQP